MYIGQQQCPFSFVLLTLPVNKFDHFSIPGSSFKVTQPNGDYFPFGKISKSSETINSPKEKFTGKQYDAESDLDYFGARYYNANIGRWISVDPMNGKYPSLTCYNFVAGNPVALFEVDGRFWMDVHSQLIHNAFDAVYGRAWVLENWRQMQSVQRGSLMQDIKSFFPGGYNSEEHADNSQWGATFAMAARALDNSSFGAVSDALHGIEDFYSHSNFADVVEEVFGDKIVTFDEAMQNGQFSDLWAKEGKSGAYNNPNVPKDSPNHHEQMNYDEFPEPGSKGRLGTAAYEKGFWRRFDMAQKHSNNWLEQWKKKREQEWQTGNSKQDRFDAENK